MKILLTAIILALVFVGGAFIGINTYKSHCEVIGTSATNKWRECSL